MPWGRLTLRSRVSSRGEGSFPVAGLAADVLNHGPSPIPGQIFIFLIVSLPGGYRHEYLPYEYMTGPTEPFLLRIFDQKWTARAASLLTVKDHLRLAAGGNY